MIITISHCFIDECLSRRMSYLSTSDSLSQHSTPFSTQQTDPNFEIMTPMSPLKSQRVNLVTPLVAAVLDREGISDRSASRILTAIASGMGLNVDSVTLSRNGIGAIRKKARCDSAKKIKTNVQLPKHLVVHWDGKLLSNFDDSTKVERLPVVVSGLSTNQLLGVPQLTNGSGEKQASAVVKMLEDWELSDRVKAMCFDTTASNTG